MNRVSLQSATMPAVIGLALSLLLPSAANAGGYIGLDGSSIGIGGNDGSEELNPLGFRGRLGLPVGQSLDIEAHLGFGGEENVAGVDEFGTGFAGVYLKAYIPVGERSALYGLAGGSTVQITRTLNGRETSEEHSGFSYGFGLETELTQRLDLTADWMRYASEQDQFDEVSAVNVGLKLYF